MKTQKLPWQTKLVLSGSTAIFLTFFLFSFLEYNTVSKWMMSREELAVNRQIADIMTYYKDRSDHLTSEDIMKSADFLRKMNDKDQLIRVYDKKGKILVSDKNGSFPVLEPSTVHTKFVGKILIEQNEAILAKIPLKTNEFEGTVEIIRQLNSYQKMMDHLFMVMTIFGLAAIILSAISGYFLARQLLRPIRDLAAAMKKIKENGFQERMEGYKQKDELTDLSNLFNEMMDEIEKSFSQQKQFIEDASHELRTPVSILEGHLSLLNRWGKKDPVILDESLDASLHEISRLKKLVIDLLELTRAENVRPTNVQENIDIPILLHKLVKNFEMMNPEYQFKVKLDENIDQIRISEQHLQQIFIILLDNAIKFSSENKEILILGEQDEHKTTLSVEDCGIGIPSEHVSKIFNRFYRVDKARSRDKGGTGLGLSIAKKLIEKYHGTITIESHENQGTKVSMSFPK